MVTYNNSVTILLPYNNSIVIILCNIFRSHIIYCIVLDIELKVFFFFFFRFSFLGNVNDFLLLYNDT